LLSTLFTSADRAGIIMNNKFILLQDRSQFLNRYQIEDYHN